jgi:hypothetical protein
MTTPPVSTRPNFFLLLGLNPDAAWNQTLFEETLRKKRNEWSRQGAGVAKKALVAKQNLALIPKITEVMTNAELREREAIAARKERAADQQKEQEQFEKQLAFINAQDTLDEEEIEKFVAAFQHLLPAEEIRKRINVPPPTPEAEAASAQTNTTLEESIAKNIADRLEIIHMSTLYELLAQDAGAGSAHRVTGSTQDTISTAQWLRAAELLYTRLVRLQPTAETTAKIELAGLARYVFKNDETRTSYNEMLRQSSLQRIFHELDESMSRAKKKEVNAKQVALFLNDAQKEGWSEQVALAHLKEHAQQQQWSIVEPMREPERSVPPVPLNRENQDNPKPTAQKNSAAFDHEKPANQTPPEEEKLTCPNCEHLNKKDLHYCTNCKQPLYADCPQCGQRVACDRRACGNCGFAVGNRYRVDKLLTDLDTQLHKGNLKRAEEIALEAERLWQTPPADPRHQQIARAKAEVKRLHVAHQQARKVSHDGQLTLTFTEIQIPTSGTPNPAVIPDTNAPHTVRISWAPLQEPGMDFAGNNLASIQYVIVQSSNSLNMTGKIVTTEEIAGLGRVLPIWAQDAPNSRSDECRPFVMAYYTPIVVIQQQAYVGHSQPYLCVENVSGLTSQYLGSTIRLRWQWPPTCQEVLLSYRRHTWPHHHEADATTSVVARDAYEQVGYYDLPGPIDYDCYILISAIATHKQQQFIASGIPLVMRMGTRITLTYEIIQPTFLRKQRMLRIIIDAPGVIPALQLVSKRGQIPLRRTDGELFYRIAGIGEATTTTETRQNQQRRELTIPLPEKAVAPRTYGKLFLEDDAHYRDFLIHHPSATQMRLS